MKCLITRKILRFLCTARKRESEMKTADLTFRDLLDGSRGGVYIEKVFSEFSIERKKLFKRWYRQTGEFDSTGVYPSQGLLKTPYDFLDDVGTSIMREEELWE